MPQADRPDEPRGPSASLSALLGWRRSNQGRVLSLDGAAIVRTCGRCKRARWSAFGFSHAPYFGQVGTPLYTDLESLTRAVVGLRHRRPAIIPEAQWQKGQRCPCGAPTTVQTIEQTLWFHSLPGTGRELVAVNNRDDAVELLIAPVEGSPEPSFDSFAREEIAELLTTFEGWRLAHEGALSEGFALEGTPAVRQVVMRPSDERLTADLTDATIAIRLHASALTDWPDRLEPLREAIRRGELEGHLLVDRARLETLVAVAAAECDAELEVSEWPRANLVVGSVRWPLNLANALLRIIRFGRTLPESARSLVQEIQTQHDEARESLAAMGRLRPSLRFEVDARGMVTPHGAAGPTPAFHLSRAPSVALDAAAFERALRFSCDPLPEWSDASRVCRCGAPAHLERRLLPLDELRIHRERRGARPVVLEEWREQGRGAAAVVAVVCDAHERLLERPELSPRLESEEALLERLSSDRPEWIVRADAYVHRLGPEGRVAIQLLGDLAGSCFLEDALLARLHAEAGEPPLEAPIAWTISPRALLLFDGRCPRDDIDRLMRQTALAVEQPEPVPFLLLRDVDLEVEPAGTFVDPFVAQGGA